ncbi:M28 family metallopeptidase [Shewanella gelidii]
MYSLLKRCTFPFLMVFLFSACSLSQLQGTNQDISSVTQFAPVTFDEAKYRQDIQTLASDAFEGRAPTTYGEKQTINYLSAAFSEMGLTGANQGSFLQAVPMVSYTASEVQQVTMAGIPMVHKQDVVLGSRNDIPQINIKGAPLVFVGYGIHAPEYNWNDYHGIDMRGKIAVILVNDPGFAHPESKRFNGKAMTYYGRWNYKFEEAARQGALGAIIVHQTKPAAYPWSVVRNSWTGPQQDLTGTSHQNLQVEGWMSLESAKNVFSKAQLDFESIAYKASLQPTQIALQHNADIHFENSASYTNSYNVVATLPGSEAASEHVIFTAHWDHLGKDPALTGDQIYNGALDNATGTAAILAMARQFTAQAKAGKPLKRSLTFIATTGEEQGLLGSRYYAANPIYPIDDTIAVINIDASNVYGRTKDFTIIGKGKSDLEEIIASAAKIQNRHTTAESRPEAGGFFRSDHFSFAKLGVPAIYARGGKQPINEQTATYKQAMQKKMQGCYHNTCDEYHADWDLSGALEDMTLFFQTAAAVANSDLRPGYYKETEFHHLRPANASQPSSN